MVGFCMYYKPVAYNCFPWHMGRLRNTGRGSFGPFRIYAAPEWYMRTRYSAPTL